MIETYEQYASLKSIIADCEAKLETLKPQILADMQSNDSLPVEAGNGVFSVRTTRTWQYSPELTADEKRVKESKKLEEQSGAAQIKSESATVFFTPSKVK